MRRTTISIICLAMAGLSSAQSSTRRRLFPTITLYVPGADVQSLVASIVGSDATATTYAMQCADGTDSNDCGFDGVVTLTEGPAIAAYTFAPELDANGSLAFTGYFDCSLAGTTSAVCVESFGGYEANDPGMSTETYTGTNQPYMPVLITAGDGVTSTSSGVVASTTTTTGSKTTDTSKTSAQTSGETSSGTGTAQTTSSKATSTSTAGVPAITGNSVWGLGVAAVAFALMG